MKTLARPMRAARMLNLVREIDLAAIKREAEAPFLLHLTGDPTLAAQLAAQLSATPGHSGLHPYLSTAASIKASARIVVQRGTELPAVSPIATLTVCVTGDTLPEVGAELPRPGEAARIVVAELTPEVVAQRLIPALLRVVSPELHVALARHLSVFRPAVIRGLIDEASRTNALYAASTGIAEIVPVLNLPLNVADTVVLTKNQLVMAYKIALAAGRTGKPQELITEVIGVLGSGLLFRQVARGLVGLIPVWGIVPQVAVAYAGTYVIGAAAELWATEGRTVSASELRGLYQEALIRGRTLAQRLVPRLGRARQKALPKAVPPEMSELSEGTEDRSSGETPPRSRQL